LNDIKDQFIKILETYFTDVIYDRINGFSGTLEVNHLVRPLQKRKIRFYNITVLIFHTNTKYFGQYYQEPIIQYDKKMEID
jgi:hypothetical protein